MARKVFISILGTGFYGKCKYVKDEFCSSETRFAQKAALEHIKANEWNSDDACFIFTTERACKENWDIVERKNTLINEVIKYTGLKTLLERMNLPFKPENEMIPDGKDENEMWDIFNIIYNKLQDDDELYVDLTHSFRYLPMLLLVLSNYSKFLRNISVKYISYGNFEARNKETDEAPIVDLLPISALQDWAFAAADYLENGNTERLTSLSKSTIAPILRSDDLRDENSQLLNKLVTVLQKTTEDFQTCRGLNIVNSIHLKELKHLIANTEASFIKPLYPIIKKIENSFSPFDMNKNILNGFHAAQWCFNNGLYQQAATILQENMVSYFCEKHGIVIDNEEKRGIVNSAFFIIENKTEEEQWKIKEEDKNKVKELLEDTELNNQELINSFSNISVLRNDINHFGMRSKRAPLKTSKIKDILEKEIKTVFRLLNLS